MIQPDVRIGEGNEPPTHYEKLTYEGRCKSESESLGTGYIGSCGIETHVAQCRSPKSWVHSSLSSWA